MIFVSRKGEWLFMTDLNGFDLSGLVDSFKPDFSFHDQMMADMQREQNQMYESLRIQGEEKTRRNHLQDNANQAAQTIIATGFLMRKTLVPLPGRAIAIM